MATIEQVPGELDITVIQGDDLSIQLTEAVNYSGYTFVASVHEINGADITAQTSMITSAAASTIQIDFPSTLTEALAVTTDEGSHTWRCVYTDLATATRTWVGGAFTVLTKL